MFFGNLRALFSALTDKDLRELMKITNCNFLLKKVFFVQEFPKQDPQGKVKDPTFMSNSENMKLNVTQQMNKQQGQVQKGVVAKK